MRHTLGLRAVYVAVPLAALGLALGVWNLEYHPRTWHDEGASLSVAKTIARDGYYGTRNSDGYQTYGAVQSVGPTLILPVALSFRVFDIGLLQARLVAVSYFTAAITVFFIAACRLRGPRWAAVALLLLLGSPGAAALFLGRQVLGELPAVGFFLAGWVVWNQSRGRSEVARDVCTGLLFGAAMLTKAYYAPMTAATIAAIGMLDLVYYRVGVVRSLLRVGVVSLLVVAAWTGAQYIYFGAAVFHENAAKLAALMEASGGFVRDRTTAAVRYALGAESGYFYYFWGVPAWLYAAYRSTTRDRNGLALGFLVVFTALWLGSWAFTLGIKHYAAPGFWLSAMFVMILWADLVTALCPPTDAAEPKHTRHANAWLGSAVLLVIAGAVTYSLQERIRREIVPKDEAAHRAGALLSQLVQNGEVVETWERELGILADLNFHFPPQEVATEFLRQGYRGAILSRDYFAKHRPAYLVVGTQAKLSSGRSSHNVYDMEFVRDHARPVATCGDYDIYRFDQR